MIKRFCCLLSAACLGLPLTADAQFLIQPESVEYDLPRNRHLVSNYSNGQIIEIDQYGVQNVFAEGKSSSAGLCILGNTVYVGCGAEGILGYDLETGQEVMDILIPGSQLLNDITADTSGNLYISDPYGNKIYRVRLSDESYSTLVEYILWPNGLLFDEKNNRLLVARSTYSDICAVDLADGSFTQVVNVGSGHLDGLAEDNAGRIYVSAQGPEVVYRYNADLSGPRETVSSGHEGPADIYFNKRTHVLCVPNIGSTTVDFVPIDVPQWTKITSGDPVSDGGFSRSVSWIDYDQDDVLDLFVTNMNMNDAGQVNFLYHHDNNGALARITGQIIATGGGSLGCSWGDYDNDGDLDVYMANPGIDGGGAANYFYTNNGDGTFAGVTGEAIVAEQELSMTPAWGDYDNDGLVDLLVTNHCVPPCGGGVENSLFHNDGNGFTRMTNPDIGLDEDDGNFACWADYDDDGDLDLFLTRNEKNNALFQNDGDGTFTKLISGVIVEDTTGGGSWGDYDNDGDLDLFAVNYGGGSHLYQNTGGGGFTEVSSSAGVDDVGYWVSSGWADYDNDGDLDLFVTGNEYYTPAENALYANNGDGTFSRITTESIATDLESSEGTAWGDYDRDGDLDLFVANGNYENNSLYCNNGNGNNWIIIRCIGTASNRAAIGTKIHVKSRFDLIPVRQMREISGQTGHFGQNDLCAHFGLNNAAQIDSLVVEWPSGVVEIGTAVAVNGFLTLVEGAMDPDGDSVIGSFDNCPDDFNPDQEDVDGDRVGEVCDECPGDAINDPDEDDYCGLVDNCPVEYNPTQSDGDIDGIGDACDNCPETYNPEQEDMNFNGIGDSCEIPETWYVQADGLGEAPTIQAAIDSTTYGDTIVVADGTYTGVGNREIDLRGRRILLTSANGPQMTIINPQGSSSTPRRAFTIAQGEGAETIIAGLTIRGGYGGSFNGSASGGGMLCNESSPTVRNCVFADNGAVAGAAVYSFRASPQFVNCTFYDNSASLGSAVFSYDQSSVTLENCIIAFNPQGVPVSCYEGSSASATCTDIYGNTAGNWVACLADQGSTNGNFSLNPLFCDTAAGDFSIGNNSPCAPVNNECAVLIGAQDIGCYCDCGVAGDMDCSGLATPLDVTFLVKFVYLTQDALCPLPDCPYPVGDLDCNSQVTPLDVAYIVNAVYKLQNAICDGCAQ